MRRRRSSSWSSNTSENSAPIFNFPRPRLNDLRRHNYGTFLNFLLSVREREGARLSAATAALARLEAEAASEASGGEPAGPAAPVELVLGEGCESIGVRFAPVAAPDGGGPATLRVAAVVEGSAAAQVEGLRPGAELLAVQGQAVGGWEGGVALKLLRRHATERPLRLRFSAGLLQTLSTTELLGTASTTAAASRSELSRLERVEVGRRVTMAKFSLLRVDALLCQVLETEACRESLGSDMATFLTTELAEEMGGLGEEASLLEAMGVAPAAVAAGGGAIAA
eukprot:COSAG04_NODE_4741_length_1916_cov_2.675289_2_plen_282_part_00